MKDGSDFHEAAIQNDDMWLFVFKDILEIAIEILREMLNCIVRSRTWYVRGAGPYR